MTTKLMVVLAGCGLMASLPCGAGPELSPEVRQLVAVKQKLTKLLVRLPDYTCVETIERSNPNHTDTLRMDVGYIGNKEVYSWPGAQKFEEKRPSQMVARGMVSDGDFVMHTRSIFSDGVAEITFAGRETLMDRPAARYNYRIPSLASAWRLRTAAGAGVVGSRGSFWIDTQNLELMRLDIDAEGIPPNLNIKAVHVRIDYARVRLGYTDVLLPKASDTELEEANGTRDVNHVEFTGCREYHVKSLVSFDTDAPPAPAPAIPVPLRAMPADLLLSVRLTNPIDSGSAAEGDVVEAAIERNAVWQGAILKGRIRRMERSSQPMPHFVLGIQFTDVEVGNNRGEFTGRLERAASKGIIAMPSDIPGEATFQIDGTHFRLDSKFQMRWRTIAAPSAPPTPPE